MDDRWRAEADMSSAIPTKGRVVAWQESTPGLLLGGGGRGGGVRHSHTLEQSRGEAARIDGPVSSANC